MLGVVGQRLQKTLGLLDLPSNWLIPSPLPLPNLYQEGGRLYTQYLWRKPGGLFHEKPRFVTEGGPKGFRQQAAQFTRRALLHGLDLDSPTPFWEASPRTLPRAG